MGPCARDPGFALQVVWRCPEGPWGWCGRAAKCEVNPVLWIYHQGPLEDPSKHRTQERGQELLGY